MEITRTPAIEGPPGLVIATLRMYRPICKQSNLDSPSNIIFLRYLLSRQFTSSLPLSFLVYVIRPDATAFIFMRQVIVVIKIGNVLCVVNVVRNLLFPYLIMITDNEIYFFIFLYETFYSIKEHFVAS